MVRDAENTQEFQRRMRWCIRKKGSVYALAKQVGVVPNAIRSYLRRSEPTRPRLVAIARECNVSVDWLATGSVPLAPPDYKPTDPAT